MHSVSIRCNFVGYELFKQEALTIRLALFILLLTGFFVAGYFLHFRYQLSPIRTLWFDRGIVYSTRDKTDEYYVANCDVFDDKDLVLQLAGWKCRFLPDGRVIIKLSDSMAMLDSDQNIIWRKNVDAHHDIHVDLKNEEIAFLSTDIDERWGKVDAVRVFDFKGNETFLWKATEQLDYLIGQTETNMEAILESFRVASQSGNQQGLIKLNSIRILGKEAEGSPYFKPGQLLINMSMDRLTLILDRKTRKPVWSHPWISPFQALHAPRVLDKDRMVYFRNRFSAKPQSLIYRLFGWLYFYPNARLDNKTNTLMITYEEDLHHIHDLRQSNVVIFNLNTGLSEKEFTWPYFYSPYLGNVEILSNGNLLISDISTGGKAFELTLDGRIVEQFVMPLPVSDTDSRPAFVQQILRYPKSWILPLVESSQ